MKYILIILCLISSFTAYSDNETGTGTEVKKPRKTVSISRVVASNMWYCLKLNASFPIAQENLYQIMWDLQSRNGGNINYISFAKCFIAASIAAQSVYGIKKLADECAEADQAT